MAHNIQHATEVMQKLSVEAHKHNPEIKEYISSLVPRINHHVSLKPYTSDWGDSSINLQQLAHQIHKTHFAKPLHHSSVGGGLDFDSMGRGIARGMSYAGSAGEIMGGATAAAGVVLSVAGAPEFGAPLVAAGGVTYALGAGSKKLGELAGSDVKTPNVTGGMFKL